MSIRDRRGGGRREPSSVRRLTSASPAEQEGAILEIVRAQVAVVLGHDAPDAVGIGQTFKELGLDSLAVLELRNRLTHATGLSLPATLAFDYPSASEITNYLLSQLQRSTPVDAALPQLRAAPGARFDAFSVNDIQQAYLAGRSGVFELGRVSAHLYCEAELAGLNVERLEDAINRLISRHDMLRAIFPQDGGQRVLATVPRYAVSVADFSGASAQAVHDHVQAVRGQLSHEVRPADRWPLFEFRVTVLPEGVALLHVSLDMLVMDLSSMGLLVGELRQLYGEPDRELEPPEVTFRDYLLAERQVEGTDLFERSKNYWMQRLPSLPAGPELPLARPPATLDRQIVVRREHRLEAARWSRIKARAAEAGVTPSIAVMSAFAQVLAYWSKSRRFILNVTTSNRLPLHPRVEAIVGDFTTLELLEVDARCATGLSAFANALQEQLWRDLEHCHFSGIRVLGELARARNEGSLVAPIVFTSGLGIDGDVMGNVTYSVSQTPQVLLDHLVFEADGSLLLSWDSVDDVFPAGMLDDMFDAYCRYLEAVADRDELWSGAAEYDWLPAKQRSAREELRRTSTLVEDDVSDHTLLHSGFLARADAQPHRSALVWSEGEMTYGELRELAAGLAARLQACGVRPNSLVGVSLEKGWRQVVAVLGVLVAGGAYLPVDPELPDRRRHQLLEHAGASVVVTGERSASYPSEVLRVELEDRNRSDRGDLVPPVRAASDLAYVIYTSGSTGTPKGVAMTHRATWNTIRDVNDRFGVGAEDRVLALSSLSFDLSVYDLFGVLAAGGCVVLPD
ncbi:MAG TPA: AMP-binding protein, partial [Solirubrobacteraceae bacterium]|nr:AMP-binding protein [Solirubrobacteraceae bacterium]